MARYLDLRLGVTEIRYVCGTRDSSSYEWYTHGWLEVDGVIVDLTADQFDEVKEPVIVSPIAMCGWHNTWPTRSASRYPELWAFHEEAAHDFEATLNEITKLLM